MICIFLFALLISLYNSESLFNGEWHLDTGKDIGSCRDVLRLIGVSYLRSSIICSLEITETMDLTPDLFHLVRSTKYSPTDQIFRLNEEEEVDDLILGNILQRVTMMSERVMKIVARRPDNATFVGQRRVLQSNDALLYVMNYTSAEGIRASVIRHFYKK
jgi:hypothetical protein